MIDIPKPKILPVAMRENEELGKIPNVSSVASITIGNDMMINPMVS
jgi:hypothetical protein